MTFSVIGFGAWVSLAMTSFIFLLGLLVLLPIPLVLYLLWVRRHREVE